MNNYQFYYINREESLTLFLLFPHGFLLIQRNLHNLVPFVCSQPLSMREELFDSRVWTVHCDGVEEPARCHSAVVMANVQPRQWTEHFANVNLKLVRHITLEDAIFQPDLSTGLLVLPRADQLQKDICICSCILFVASFHSYDIGNTYKQRGLVSNMKRMSSMMYSFQKQNVMNVFQVP